MATQSPLHLGMPGFDLSLNTLNPGSSASGVYKFLLGNSPTPLVGAGAWNANPPVASGGFIVAAALNQLPEFTLTTPIAYNPLTTSFVLAVRSTMGANGAQYQLGFKSAAAPTPELDITFLDVFGPDLQGSLAMSTYSIMSPTTMPVANPLTETPMIFNYNALTQTAEITVVIGGITYSGSGSLPATVLTNLAKFYFYPGNAVSPDKFRDLHFITWPGAIPDITAFRTAYFAGYQGAKMTAFAN